MLLLKTLLLLRLPAINEDDPDAALADKIPVKSDDETTVSIKIIQLSIVLFEEFSLSQIPIPWLVELLTILILLKLILLAPSSVIFAGAELVPV